MHDSTSDVLGHQEMYRFPASFAQQRLWLIDQLAPAGPLYSIYRIWAITGDLDVPALGKSLEHIFHRHEPLRTTFDFMQGEVVQLISPSGRLAFMFEDLMDIQEADCDVTLHERVRHECEAPFDLKTGPLFRCRLLRRSGTEHVLILNMHHIISDGWSLDVVSRELSHLYRAYSHGHEPDLPALPVQYADYAVWQRDWLSGDVLERERSYWVGQLAGSPPLELPLDRPRPGRQTFNGAVHLFDVPADLADRLLLLGGAAGATPFMTLLAAFMVLLHKYSRQSDFCVGSPVTNRGKVELEPLIGLFVNTLVIRSRIVEGETFSAFLERLRNTALDAYSHQEFPFEKIVESLHLERDLSRPPIVQVMFSFNEAGSDTLRLEGLEVSSLRIPRFRRTAKFDLTLFVTDRGGAGFSAGLEFNSDMFDVATIERLAGHFTNLIRSMVEQPEAQIAELGILSDDEYRDLVHTRNQTSTDYPRNADLATLLHAAVDRTPNAVAVQHNEEKLTYRELDERANQLASFLRSKGASSQSMIGVCLPPSIAAIVATAAVIKLGGVYVPLDHEYPRERLAFMLDDAGARLVVTRSELADRLPAASIKGICVDQVARDLVRQPVQRPAVDHAPDQLAYIMYTSGSTGMPKGVAVPHRAIVRLVMNTDYIQLGPADRIAQISNLAFDAATFEVWGALLNSARLVIIDREVVLSGEAFVREIRARNITALFATTALFNVLAESAPGGFESLQTLLVGGEAADPKWVRQVLRDGAPGRLLNAYGPTENTTFSTCYAIASVEPDAISVPIGGPIANTEAYVLDNHLQPVPPGVPGELYLGGDGLAAGYWNRPELTRERFIAHPFRVGGDARLYKTGDLVRYRPDGNLEFLGRVDRQVKLRGFRIELEEIEAHANQHPAVKDSAVVLRDEAGKDPHLAAYLVPMQGSELDDRAVKAFLAERLPAYMIPKILVSLSAMPLGPTGKVNRGALPPPRPATIRAQAADTGELEQQIAEIWAKLLETAKVSLDDNFFEMGGHSLLGVRLLFEIERKLGHRLALSALFKAPTVAGLAALIRAGSRGAD